MVERNRGISIRPKERPSITPQLHRELLPGLNSFEARRREPGIHDVPLANDAKKPLR